MLPDAPEHLREALRRAAPAAASTVSDGRRRIAWGKALAGTCLADAAALAGRAVMLAVGNQFAAARALLDLDGMVRRMVVLPPDVDAQHYPAIIRDAGVEAVVCSDPAAFAGLGLPLASVAAEAEGGAPPVPSGRTEWLLLTSGTTGDPKLAIHGLAGLAGAIAPPAAGRVPPAWATFYDIRRYGGLQIYLRSVFSGGSLVLSQPHEAIGDHLRRLAAERVSHVSGTPSHWRRALMTGLPPDFAPAYVRLSGEIADQAVLDALTLALPHATVGTAYASTEAGVGFEVNDGRAGFPASYLATPQKGVELRLVDGCLQLRSGRRALGYAGRPDLMLADADGWVDSGDMVEVRDGRACFLGRRNGVINVGGLKVHPEEVEAVINRQPGVRQSKVRARKSPIIGAIIVADVAPAGTPADPEALKRRLLEACSAALPAHKVPALITLVEEIVMTAGGKVARNA